MNDILIRLEEQVLVCTERPAIKSSHLSAEGTDLFYALAPDGRVQPFLVDRLGRASRYKVAQCGCSACAAATIFETKPTATPAAQLPTWLDRIGWMKVEQTFCVLGVGFMSGCALYVGYLILNAVLWGVTNAAAGR